MFSPENFQDIANYILRQNRTHQIALSRSPSTNNTDLPNAKLKIGSKDLKINPHCLEGFIEIGDQNLKYQLFEAFYPAQNSLTFYLFIFSLAGKYTAIGIAPSDDLISNHILFSK